MNCRVSQRVPGHGIKHEDPRVTSGSSPPPVGAGSLSDLREPVMSVQGQKRSSLAAYAVYSAVFSATVRYQLTLRAEVDGEPKTGSGVIEVTYSKNNDPISQAEFSIDVRGEAVVLDLGPRGTLFALLRAGTDSRSGPEYIVLKAFNLPGGALPSPVTSGLQQVRHLSGKRELPLKSLPLLVRFLDVNNPKTLERVDPLHLQKSFGSGVELKRATLEIVPSGIWPFNSLGVTGEPITMGVNRRLKWLDRLDQYRSDPSNPFSTTLPPEIGGLSSN